MLISVKNMYRMEDECGIDKGILMENAGRKIFEELLPMLFADSSILILAGNGNNGGDGIVLAHHLREGGFKYRLVFTEKIRSKLAMSKLEKYDLPHEFYESDTDLSANFIVDAMFGIGFKGIATEHYQEIFERVNQEQATKISIDIPSGMNGDLPFVTTAVRANHTFIIQCPKPSAALNPTKEYYGEQHVLDVGIAITSNELEVVEKIELPERKMDSHKGSHGRGLLIAGSASMSGAATSATLAATRCGLGLLKVATTKAAQRMISTYSLEAMYEFLPEDEVGFIADISAVDFAYPDCIAIGCGLGREEHDYLSPLLSVDKPIIIDADGLYHLAKNLDWLSNRVSSTVVLTPHEVEMSRLSGLSLEEIQADRLGISYDFATKHKVYLVLKGPKTIITTPEGQQFINDTGNDTLAKGGTGDMLTGMILGMMGGNPDTAQALKAAVYLHAMTGNLYKQIFGQTISAGIEDLINLIPSALAKVSE